MMETETTVKTAPDAGVPVHPIVMSWHRSRERAVAEVTIAALTPITALVLILGLSPSVKFIVLCIAAASVPGAAILARSPFRHTAAGISLVVVSSLTVDGMLSIGLLWAHWFHPAIPAAVIGTASSLRLLVVSGPAMVESMRGDGRSDSHPDSGPRAAGNRPRFLRMGLAISPLIVGLVLWRVSLHGIDLNDLGNSGLLGIVPKTWYAGLFILSAGCVYEVWRSRSGWLIAAYLGALALVIVGTIPAIDSVPQYSWVYKHIAIISLFNAHGAVSPSVDIYNRYPGMFALAAALSRLTGLSALAYANWTQVVFTWLIDLLIFAVAYTIVAERRVAAIAALMYLAGNWIGQIYLAPQTLALALFLGFLLLLIGERSRPNPSALVSKTTNWLGARLGGRLRNWFPADSQTFGPEPLIDGRIVVVLLLAITFFINATHQLTPYMLLIAFGLLVFTRSVKGLWTWLACVVITLGYLAANYSWLQSHYGLLQSFSLSSAVGVTTYGLPVHRAALYADSGGLIVFVMLMATFASALVLLRSGHVQKMVVLLIMALAPALILGGQDYGGEGPLRVFLFWLPWQALMIGFALHSLRAWLAWLAAAAFAAITAVILLLTLITTAGNATVTYIPSGEVRAALYINDHIRSGAALIEAGGNFIPKIGARYPDYAGAVVNDAPDLFDDQPGLAKNLSNAETVSRVASEIRRYASYGVIVFSRSAYEYAAVDHTVAPARLRAIEQAVAGSSTFRLWYANADAHVYRLAATSVTRP